MYSPNALPEPFEEAAPPPVSPERDIQGDYFQTPSVAWRRRSSVTSRSPEIEFPPKPIFTPSSPTKIPDQAALQALSLHQSGTSPPSGSRSILSRNKSRTSIKGSFKRNAFSGRQSSIGGSDSILTESDQLPQSPGNGQPDLPTVQPIIPSSPTSPGGKDASIVWQPSSSSSSPPPSLSSPPRIHSGPPRKQEQQQYQQQPPPHHSQRLQPSLPPLSMPLHQPPPSNRPVPHPAIASSPFIIPSPGPMRSESRRTSGSGSSLSSTDRTIPPSAESSVSSSSLVAINNGKLPAPMDLSNPYRSATERPLDTIKRLSRQADRQDYSRLSSYGSQPSVPVYRSDDLYMNRIPSYPSSPSSSPQSPSHGFPSTAIGMVGSYPSLSMDGAYPSSLSMNGPFPFATMHTSPVSRSSRLESIGDSSPWPVWNGPLPPSPTSDKESKGKGPKRHSTIRKKGKNNSDNNGVSTVLEGDEGKPQGMRHTPSITSHQTFSKSPLSQTSRPPSPTEAASAPASVSRSPTTTTTKKKRLSLWGSKSSKNVANISVASEDAILLTDEVGQSSLFKDRTRMKSTTSLESTALRNRTWTGRSSDREIEGGLIPPIPPVPTSFVNGSSEFGIRERTASTPVAPTRPLPATLPSDGPAPVSVPASAVAAAADTGAVSTTSSSKGDLGVKPIVLSVPEPAATTVDPPSQASLTPLPNRIAQPKNNTPVATTPATASSSIRGGRPGNRSASTPVPASPSAATVKPARENKSTAKSLKGREKKAKEGGGGGFWKIFGFSSSKKVSSTSSPNATSNDAGKKEIKGTDTPSKVVPSLSPSTKPTHSDFLDRSPPPQAELSSDLTSTMVSSNGPMTPPVSTVMVNLTSTSNTGMVMGKGTNSGELLASSDGMTGNDSVGSSDIEKGVPNIDGIGLGPEVEVNEKKVLA
ncbi:Protein of unknown function DUF2406 [Phaffia rhodozyma]|uniref:Uncharacterized protein n=1 Tax=Phaffia rhodozyma TaxID=264483 RepID=A0A0F7SV08_PHARH|nr:Protein of unknown function DUF2406 [Phaffia rhodozyma]